MIGRLQGSVVEVGQDGSVILDVRGVGYEVFVGDSLRLQLHNPSEPQVLLYVHTHMREGSLTLYGFQSARDRLAFRTLLTVAGVGPKLALAIIGRLDANALAAAIGRQDKTAFKGISGVGKRTVERLLIDLKDKLPAVVTPITGVRAKATDGPWTSTSENAVNALVQMGYRRPEAEVAVSSVAAENSADVETVLRAALVALG